jgi:hypothetical protein
MESTGGMKNPDRLVFVVLAIAIIAVDAVAVAASIGLQFPHVAVIVLLALGLAQVGLLATWLATGPGNIYVRLIACLLAVLGCAWAFANTTLPTLLEWLGALGFYLLAVAAPVFLFRWLVVMPPARCNMSRDVEPDDNGETAGEAATATRPKSLPSRVGGLPRQWSIAGILTLTTVVAVALGFARAVEFPAHEGGSVIFTCIGFALTTLLALFIACGIKKRRWHLLALVLTCSPIGAVIGLMFGPLPYVAAMTVVALIQSLLVVFVIDVIQMPKSAA